MVLTAGVQLKLCDEILPGVRGDLAISRLWNGDFYGKDLDARAVLDDYGTEPSMCSIS